VKALLRWLAVLAILAVAANALAQPVEVDIKDSDRIVSALAYGQDVEHTVIALHGAGEKKSIFKAVAPELAKRGFKIISIDWPAGPAGAPPGMGPLATAVQYARASGAKKVSLLGFSRGGELAARYASAQPDGEFDTLILLASYDDQPIPLTKTKKLFVFHDNDPYGRWSQVSADKSSEPKQVFALKGRVHSLSALFNDKPDLLDVIATTLGK
jgi:pimeloyl-ACP methyl ester carboxylesterase